MNYFILCLISFSGSGKSTIFTKLTQATNKREKFEAKRQASTLPDSIIDNNVGKKKQATKKNDEKEKHDWTRHSITNDVICILLYHFYHFYFRLWMCAKNLSL